MTMRHAIVWLDHVEATVTRFSRDRSATTQVVSARPKFKLHTKSGRPGSGHQAPDVDLFERIAAAIGDSTEIVITGPGIAKTALERYLHSHHIELAQCIVGCEPLDHPTSRQLLAFGRNYFRRVDALRGDS